MFKKLLKASEPPLSRQLVCSRCWRLCSRIGEFSCADGRSGFNRAPDGGVCGRTGWELLLAFRDELETCCCARLEAGALSVGERGPSFPSTIRSSDVAEPPAAPVKRAVGFSELARAWCQSWAGVGWKDFVVVLGGGETGG